MTLENPNHTKNKKNQQKFFLLEIIKVALRIIINGVSSSTFVIVYVILRILAFAVLGFLLFGGLAGLIVFVMGVYNKQPDLAFKGMLANYIYMSIATFGVYFYDKRQARLNLWRTPEAQLHYLELFGGWIGAFLAQVFLRHKSSKASFQVVYWLIVFFHFSLFLFYIPASFSYAIPRGYILGVNIFLFFLSLGGIKK